jgi:hypothetical protein
MKSFRIEAAVYRWLTKEHPQFACEMKKMESKQKYEKEFVSAVSAFVIFIAFVTHIAILPAKSCIAWSALGWFKRVRAGLVMTDDRPFFVCNLSHCDGFSDYPGSLFLKMLVALPFPLLLPCFAMRC